jgi:hypothetical protein
MPSAYATQISAAMAAETGDVINIQRPRMSWQAILAGVILVMALEVLLGVLGAAIGLGALHPGTPETPDASTLASNAGLWSLGSAVVSLIVGGWATARLAGVVSRSDGMLHGLVIWGLALLLTVYLIASAAGGAVSVLGGLAASAGGGLRAVAPQMAGLSGDSPGEQARALLQPPQSGDLAAMSPEDAQKDVTNLLPQMAAGGDQGAQARGRIIDIMAVQLKISHDDAAHRLDEAQARFEQGVRSAASEGAQAASHGAMVAFAGLLIGAVAAALGGALARPRVLLAPNRFR